MIKIECNIIKGEENSKPKYSVKTTLDKTNTLEAEYLVARLYNIILKNDETMTFDKFAKDVSLFAEDIHNQDLIREKNKNKKGKGIK